MLEHAKNAECSSLARTMPLSKVTGQPSSGMQPRNELSRPAARQAAQPARGKRPGAGASQPANRPARSSRPNTARVCRLCGQSSTRYSSRGQCSACTPVQQGERTGEQETARNSFRLINRSTSASFFFYSAYTVLSILCNSNRSSNLCLMV